MQGRRTFLELGCLNGERLQGTPRRSRGLGYKSRTVGAECECNAVATIGGVVRESKSRTDAQRMSDGKVGVSCVISVV